MNTQITYEHLAGLRDALPELRDALMPGTPRRWSQRDLTDDQRARMNALAIAEREAKQENMTRGITALGDGRAPLRLDVLDVIGDIELAVVDLEAAVCDRLNNTPLAGVSTADRITRLIGFLDRIANDPDLSDHVADEAARMRRQARRALGDAEPVTRIDSRCPHCHARSLRAFPERESVICVNSACRCDEEDCRCHAEQPRRHRWLRTQWEGLAKKLSDEPHAMSA